jgi:hypothetical protein
MADQIPDSGYTDPSEVGLDTEYPSAPSRPDVIVKESDALQVHPENVPRANPDYRNVRTITNPAG